MRERPVKLRKNVGILIGSVADAFAYIFERARSGDDVAREAVYHLAFQRLRKIAGSLLRRERAGHTLQPTALISELFLKLLRMEARIIDEDHFFRLSARAMRQVLIDYARTRGAGKRVAIEQVAGMLAATDRDHDAAVAAKIVFQKLRSMNARVAETVWARCVEGRTAEEVSRLQMRELWRVRADCDFGLQWMANQLGRYV
jgi:RNA polymerase sigma factor (TIGR02999 family)